MSRREELRKVLHREVKRWAAMSCGQLLSELHDPVIEYQVEFEAAMYHVKVVLLENREEYLHVIVFADDGHLAAGTHSLNYAFIRRKPPQPS